MNFWFVSRSVMLFCSMSWMFGRNSSRGDLLEGLVHGQVDLRIDHDLAEVLDHPAADARREWPRASSVHAGMVRSGRRASRTLVVMASSRQRPPPRRRDGRLGLVEPRGVGERLLEPARVLAVGGADGRAGRAAGLADVEVGAERQGID